ncbi:ABC-type transport auxiliary lipoprotein family protein [Nitrosomonas cryotolerans]|nr:ABC-type transport auxiliary lipoprotein family protein [Nitrosomonas cryotolerans]
MRKILILIMLLLSGCAVGPRSEVPVAIYDLGLVHSPHVADAVKSSRVETVNLLVAEVISPIWLDSQAIRYRFAYHNSSQSYAYAYSRWIAAPAVLLTERMRSRIVTDTDNKVIRDKNSAKADYGLYTELEEFSQVFDAADNSHVVISLRAHLIEQRTRLILAQHRFHINITALTPDATGAVTALTEGTNELLDNLLDWLTKEVANRKLSAQSVTDN